MSWDRDYRHYPRPVAQFDQTECWAAGLEWWLRCMSASRGIRVQNVLLNQFLQYWNHDLDDPEYGTIDGNGLGHIMDDPSIRMDYVVKPAGSWDSKLVESKLAISPILIAYNEIEVGGFHVNVIHSLNSILLIETFYGEVNVMDPNMGRFRSRSHSSFTTRNYVLAWAKM